MVINLDFLLINYFVKQPGKTTIFDALVSHKLPNRKVSQEKIRLVNKNTNTTQKAYNLNILKEKNLVILPAGDDPDTTASAMLAVIYRMLNKMDKSLMLLPKKKSIPVYIRKTLDKFQDSCKEVGHQVDLIFSNQNLTQEQKNSISSSSLLAVDYPRFENIEYTLRWLKNQLNNTFKPNTNFLLVDHHGSNTKEQELQTMVFNNLGISAQVLDDKTIPACFIHSLKLLLPINKSKVNFIVKNKTNSNLQKVGLGLTPNLSNINKYINLFNNQGLTTVFNKTMQDATISDLCEYTKRMDQTEKLAVLKPYQDLITKIVGPKTSFEEQVAELEKLYEGFKSESDAHSYKVIIEKILTEPSLMQALFKNKEEQAGIPQTLNLVGKLAEKLRQQDNTSPNLEALLNYFKEKYPGTKRLNTAEVHQEIVKRLLSSLSLVTETNSSEIHLQSGTPFKVVNLDDQMQFPVFNRLWDEVFDPVNPQMTPIEAERIIEDQLISELNKSFLNIIVIFHGRALGRMSSQNNEDKEELRNILQKCGSPNPLVGPKVKASIHGSCSLL